MSSLPPLRILHLTSSLQIGGAETMLVSLLRELASSQSLVTVNQVLYFHAGPQVAVLQALAAASPTTCAFPQQIKGGLGLYDPVFWWRLYRAARQFQPDLIHSQLWSANIAGRILGKLLGIPVINTLHSPVISSSTTFSRSYYFRRLCDWLTVKWADRLVAVSPSTAQALAPYCRGQEVIVIPNGVVGGADVSRRSPKGMGVVPRLRTRLRRASLYTSLRSALTMTGFKHTSLERSLGAQLPVLPLDRTRDKLRSQSDAGRDVAGQVSMLITSLNSLITYQTFIIGFVGRLVASKNVAAILQSLATLALKYPQVRLIIVGAGPLKVSLQQQAQALGVAERIQWVETTDVQPYYRQFSCLVQPSWYEGLSMALLEAGAVGLPCIVSGPVQHDLIIDQVNGLLIDPAQPAGLTQALERLILAPALGAKLGGQLQALVREKYSVAVMAQRYQELYRGLR